MDRAGTLGGPQSIGDRGQQIHRILGEPEREAGQVTDGVAMDAVGESGIGIGGRSRVFDDGHDRGAHNLVFSSMTHLTSPLRSVNAGRRAKVQQ